MHCHKYRQLHVCTEYLRQLMKILWTWQARVEEMPRRDENCSPVGSVQYKFTTNPKLGDVSSILSLGKVESWTIYYFRL